MPRKHHLIKHPPARSMSERGEVRILTKQLRKLENAEPTPENIKIMLRLSQRIGKLRASINKHKNGTDVKRSVGRPKVEKPVEPTPEPVKVESEFLARPNPVEKHVQRAAAKAEIRKAREAEENSLITAPLSDIQEAADGITPPKMTPDEARCSSGITPQTMPGAFNPAPQQDPWEAYQDAVARGEELHRRYQEQHPASGEPRERGQLTDSFTGLPVKRDEW